MRPFKKKSVSAEVRDSKIQNRRQEAFESISKFENFTLYNGDDGVVEEYDKDAIALDFDLINNFAIILRDPDLFNYSIWLATSLERTWWDSDMETNARVYWRFVCEKMEFQAKYKNEEFYALSKALTNLYGAMHATMQTFETYGDTIMFMANNAQAWSKEMDR